MNLSAIKQTHSSYGTGWRLYSFKDGITPDLVSISNKCVIFRNNHCIHSLDIELLSNLMVGKKNVINLNCNRSLKKKKEYEMISEFTVIFTEAHNLRV